MSLTCVGALEAAFNLMFNDIADHKKANGHAILLLTVGESHLMTSLNLLDRTTHVPDSPTVVCKGWIEKFAQSKGDLLRQYIDLCFERQILVVVSAGNQGLMDYSKGEPHGPPQTLDEQVPQNIGKADNALVTVGGIDEVSELRPSG